MNNKKNSCYFEFSEELDLTEFCDEDLFLEHKIKYKLYGVINHIDSKAFGHYYSYIKIYINSMWYEYSNSQINNLGVQLPDCQNAYSLFYIKI